MKTQNLFLPLLFSGCIAGNSLNAQSLDRYVVGAAGNYSTASWGSISATVGEGVINTSITPSAILTQGFQQPTRSNVAVYQVAASNASVKVYPVPATDVVNVQIISDNPAARLSVRLYDLLGQQLVLPSQESATGIATNRTFDISSIASGQYFIMVTDELNQLTKTIQFTKLN